MNLTALSISFGIIFGILILALLALGILYLYLYEKRSEWEESKNDIAAPSPLELCAEDATIRIRGAEVEVFETPQESAREEVREIRILPSARASFADKYERLPHETRVLLDEFASRFSSIPDCSRALQTGALVFRYQKRQLARATIRRDAVYLSFTIFHPGLGELVKRERTGIRMKPVEIRLRGESDLEAAMQTAELAVENFRRQEERKRELRREARKEALRRRKEEAAMTQPEP